MVERPVYVLGKHDYYSQPLELRPMLQTADLANAGPRSSHQ